MGEAQSALLATRKPSTERRPISARELTRGMTVRTWNVFNSRARKMMRKPLLESVDVVGADLFEPQPSAPKPVWHQDVVLCWSLLEICWLLLKVLAAAVPALLRSATVLWISQLQNRLHLLGRIRGEPWATPLLPCL